VRNDLVQFKEHNSAAFTMISKDFNTCSTKLDALQQCSDDHDLRLKFLEHEHERNHGG